MEAQASTTVEAEANRGAETMVLRADPGPRARFTLSESLRLDHADMDATHEAFCDAIDRLMDVEDALVAERVDALIAHTVEHFEQERQWMAATQFPALSCHDGEHQRVLAICEVVRQRVAEGDLEIGRVLGRELIPWFDHHGQSMDAILAHWLKQHAERVARGEPMPEMASPCGTPEHACPTLPQAETTPSAE